MLSQIEADFDMGEVEVFIPLEIWLILPWQQLLPCSAIPTLGREAPTGGLSKSPQALLQRYQGIENHKPLQDPRQYQILPQT